MQHWFPAYIALGSNMGDSLQQMQVAINRIAALDGVLLVSSSSFYRSVPYGPVEQNDFINSVVAVLTTYNPQALMQHLLNIENALGRKREQRWGPRTIDLDLLVYSQQTLSSEFLKLPHPEIDKRNFVLLPLCEIARYVDIPGLGRVNQLANSIDQAGLEKL